MKENKNPDWKQWLPGYGLYKSIKAIHNEEPSILDSDSITKNAICLYYHSIIVTGLIISSYIGLEKLLSH